MLESNLFKGLKIQTYELYALLTFQPNKSESFISDPFRAI